MFLIFDKKMDINKDFEKAMSHCRCSKILRKAIKDYIINENFEGKTFECIVLFVNQKFKEIKGLGQLAIIDVAKCVCNYFNIPIKQIYLMGSGPLLSLKKMRMEYLIKTQTIGSLKLKYITIEDFELLSQNNYHIFF